MEGTVPAGPVSPAWAELLALSRDETGERQLMERQQPDRRAMGREAFVIVDGSATVKRNGKKVATLGVGSMLALEETDMVVTSYRDHAQAMIKEGQSRFH